jgi:Glyoxalase-like domain
MTVIRMAFEIDHLFILTDVGAAVADRLVSLGLLEGSSGVHRGQGTANRCFFFHNVMLELLWVYSPLEAQSAPIRQTRLWERWVERDRLCPFGICLRSRDGSAAAPPFAYWEYRPPYLPENLSIAVGNNSEILTEPMLFQTPFGKRPDLFSPERAQPLAHPLGLREITRVEIVAPVSIGRSPEMQVLLDLPQVKLKVGEEYYLELGFDGERQGRQENLRPELPLLICW